MCNVNMSSTMLALASIWQQIQFIIYQLIITGVATALRWLRAVSVVPRVFRSPLCKPCTITKRLMRQLIRRTQNIEHSIKLVLITLTALLLVVGTTTPSFRNHAVGAVASMLSPHSAGCAAGDNGNLPPTCSGEKTSSTSRMYQRQQLQCVASWQAVCQPVGDNIPMQPLTAAILPSTNLVGMLPSRAPGVGAQGQVVHLRPAAPKCWRHQLRRCSRSWQTRRASPCLIPASYWTAARSTHPAQTGAVPKDFCMPCRQCLQSTDPLSCAHAC